MENILISNGDFFSTALWGMGKYDRVYIVTDEISAKILSKFDYATSIIKVDKPLEFNSYQESREQVEEIIRYIQNVHNIDPRNARVWVPYTFGSWVVCERRLDESVDYHYLGCDKQDLIYTYRNNFQSQESYEEWLLEVYRKSEPTSIINDTEAIIICCLCAGNWGCMRKVGRLYGEKTLPFLRTFIQSRLAGKNEKDFPLLKKFLDLPEKC